VKSYYSKKEEDEMMKPCKVQSVKIRANYFLFFILAVSILLAGCSQVHILKPANGATFTRGQPVEFEGQVTRSSETGGEDRSNELSWASSINGHIGDGKTFTTNTLNPGSHNITATWSPGNKSDSISIRVNP
jgi:hypothetical protein